MNVSLGANIPDPLPARVFASRSGGLYKDGLVEPRDGVRSKSSPLHFTGSKGNPRKYSKGDELYTGVDHPHGYIVSCLFDLSL